MHYYFIILPNIHFPKNLQPPEIAKTIKSLAQVPEAAFVSVRVNNCKCYNNYFIFGVMF